MLTSSRRLMLSALVLSFCCISVIAADDENPDKRYHFEKIEGVLYRFDTVTGQMQKLTRSAGGFAWAEVEVQVGGAVVRPVQVKNSEEVRPPKSSEVLPIHNEEKDKKKKGQIQLFNDKDEDITDLVADEDRKNAQTNIAGYEQHMSISHTLKTDDKIEGTLMIRNLGQKRLKVLELTMVLNVEGREKPEEHRILFIDSPGKSGPPQPGINGKEAMSLVQKVSIPSPAGRMKGPPEVKMSYIKFAE